MKKDSKSLKTTKSPPPDGLNHALILGDGAMRQDMAGCWIEDDSLEGITPIFAIKCVHHPKEHMMMRYSHITPKEQRLSKLTGRKFIIEYKCKLCGNIARFYVDINEDYIDKVRRKRLVQGYKDLYYPLDKWKSDKIIKKRLKDLGYW